MDHSEVRLYLATCRSGWLHPSAQLGLPFPAASPLPPARSGTHGMVISHEMKRWRTKRSDTCVKGSGRNLSTTSRGESRTSDVGHASSLWLVEAALLSSSTYCNMRRLTASGNPKSSLISMLLDAAFTVHGARGTFRRECGS
jgi:hypothetical protein